MPETDAELARRKAEALAERHKQIQEAQQAQRAREAQGSRDETETDEAVQAQLDIAATQIEHESEASNGFPQESGETKSPDGDDTDPKVLNGELPPRRRGRPSGSRNKRTNPHQEGASADISNVPAVVLTNATVTSLNLPMDLPWKDWQTYARYARVLDKGLQWWIGELLVYADHRGKDWEEQGTQFMSEQGFSDHTLAQLKSVVWQFTPHLDDKGVQIGKKRHENLSFEHHREVAYLSPKDAEEILTRAEVGDGKGNNWTTNEVRDEIRARRAKGVTPPSSKVGERGRQSHKPKQEVADIGENGQAPAVASASETSQMPPAETANSVAADAPFTDETETVDGAYDFAEHTEIRNRARAAIQEWQAVGEDDLEAEHEATCNAIAVLVELRDSCERLGVEP